jgi:segregation and condensation protein B
MSRRASAHVESKPAPAPAVESVPADGPALSTRVEAILIAADRPVTLARLREALALGAESDAALTAAIEELNRFYDQSDRSFRVEAVAGGFRLMTRAAFAPDVAAIRGLRDAHKLSRPALETLAIIAYRQPITRAQIEAIRGVACGEVLKTLLDARLIAITGRAEELGRPMLYGSTRHFLETFGLASVRDLPPVDATAEKAIPTLRPAASAPTSDSDPDADHSASDSDSDSGSGSLSDA